MVLVVRRLDWVCDALVCFILSLSSCRTLAVDCLAWSARARVVAARAGVFWFDYLVLVRVFGSNRLRI